MQIIRAPRQESGYTIIRNDVLRDPELTFRARGVLAYILSHSDNWRTDAESIARVSKEGRQAIQTALKELREAGYIEYRKSQDTNGRWKTDTIVYDAPKATQAPQEPVKPSTDLTAASKIVSTVWEPLTAGKTSQPPVAVVKIVSNAMKNGVSAARIKKALTDIANAGLTVTTTRLDQALNGNLKTKKLNADNKVDWSELQTENGAAAL